MLCCNVDSRDDEKKKNKIKPRVASVLAKYASATSLVAGLDPTEHRCVLINFQTAHWRNA